MLVNCVAYHRGQKLSDIPLGEVRSHLLRPDCFVWVALKDPQPEELAVYAALVAAPTMVLIDIYLIDRFRQAKWM